jgi:hemerythrin
LHRCTFVPADEYLFGFLLLISTLYSFGQRFRAGLYKISHLQQYLPDRRNFMTRRFRIFKNIIGAILVLIGLYIIADIYIPIDNAKYERKDEELLTLTNYLINDPKYQKGTGKSRTFIRLELNGFPGANFENEHQYLQATSWASALTDIKYHDTITIKVLKRKFDKFYTNRDSLSVLEEIFYHPIDRFEFYSLRYKNKEYVNNLTQAAKEYYEERAVSTFVIGLMLIGMGVFSLLAKK